MTDDTTPPEVPGVPVTTSREDREVSPGELSSALSTAAMFLRQNVEGHDEMIGSLEEAADIARTQITPEAIPVPEERKQFPVWASSIPNSEKLFVSKSREIKLWKTVAEPISRGGKEVIVKYQRFDDVLSPGGTAHEQGIELPMIDHRFSLDEWNAIVQPILSRYVKALELKALARATQEDQEQCKEKVHKLLPQVFSKSDRESFQGMNILSQDFQTRIREMVNAINTDPKILKHWILEQLGQKKKTPVKGVSFEKGTKKMAREKKSYDSLRQQAALKRISEHFSEASQKSLDSYVDDLAARVSQIGEQLLMLNTKHREGLYRIPHIKKDYEETPYFSHLLAEFSRRAALQLEKGKGMISLIGDMGTGKNYLVEHFAAKTGRPFFYFPCSRGMDVADLGFHFEYLRGETKVLLSNLAKGLRTHNAMILIDEPNALPPEVVAGLHGLADHNRSFVYNGIEFKAVPGVIIAMAMNPATYAHVKSMPEAISDRTLGQDMVMDYPPLTKLDQLAQKNLWTKEQREQKRQEDNALETEKVCDEALILRKYFSSLMSWAPADFTNLWDVVVNGKGEVLLGEKASQMTSVKGDVEVISKILALCDAWRKKYKEGDMQRTISLRGAIAVAENYQITKNIRTAFLELYRPNSLKYDGGRKDYETVEQMLNDQGELEVIMNEELGPS